MKFYTSDSEWATLTIDEESVSLPKFMIADIARGRHQLCCLVKPFNTSWRLCKDHFDECWSKYNRWMNNEKV